MRSIGKRFRTAVIAAGATVAVAAGVITGLGPAPSGASSHREAPLTAADPQIDNTDVYAFVSPNNHDQVTLISNWIPFEEPAGGPNFYPFDDDALYDINIDNDGDAVADIIYRWTFTDHLRNPKTFLYNTGPVTDLKDSDLNFYQTYDVTRIVVGGNTTKILRGGIAVPSFVGKASMPDYARLRTEGIYETSRSGGTDAPGARGRAFAGQADDPFFLDLRVFDLLYGADLSEVGDDTLAGFNVNTVAIQAPKGQLAKGGNPTKNPIIGVWSTAERRSVRVQKSNGDQEFKGDFVQVSRLGNPLVNEVVIPYEDKDKWNSSQPKDDAQFLNYVLEPEVPELLEAIYGIPAPDNCGDDDAKPRCRTDLVGVFLTGVSGLNQPPNVVPSEQMRLNMSITPCEPGSCSSYSRLGVIGGDTAGYPNGRRLGDDVIDISLQVLEGEIDTADPPCPCPNDLGDAVNENDVSFGNTFPFVALPHSGSDPEPHLAGQA